jgi:16S rRNA (guanine527-N7)-methyltransferase
LSATTAPADAARDRERRSVAEGAAALGLPLPADRIDALLRFLDLLECWNATYNLTAVRDRAAMLPQHLLDSLALVPALHRARPAGGRLLDVGSGGGLPGVVVAVADPAWAVTCVDAVAKKAAFLRHVAGALPLPNLRAEHARVESLVAAPFDVVTARAFATLAELARLTRYRLAPGGVWAAMKGQRPDAEIAALPPDVEVFHVEPLSVPGLDAERCLVWMRPRS